MPRQRCHQHYRERDSLPKLGLVAGSGCYTRCAGDLNEVVGFLRLIAVHSWFSD
ncbi:MAG TPA: hypothetical protein VG097_20580 [Gemmata sp.]|jgi:hypothetical protein|nr:hypothetical protein [Gemmata sp.]